MNLKNYRRILLYTFLITFTLKAVSQIDSAVAVSTADSMVVTGTIFSADDNSPLNGVTITLPGIGSSHTKEDGTFAIKVIDVNSILVISGMGYQAVEIPLKGKNNISVKLHESSFSSVYDDVILSYRKEKNYRLGNAIDYMRIRPTETDVSIDHVLHGKLTGLNITSRSGAPGAGANMLIRGVNSLYANNQPLIIVDGMIFDSRDDLESLLAGNTANPLSNLDVRDIESVTLIKDGSSIYGSKAANGVLLINTFHPTDAVTKIELFSHIGMNLVPDHRDVMEADDYRIFLNEQQLNSGMTQDFIDGLPFNGDPGSEGYYRYHNNTNWQDQVFENSKEENIYLRVSGGDEVAMYGLSVGYLSRTGIIKQTNYNKYNMRFNADVNVTERLKITSNLGVAYANENIFDDGIQDRTNPLYLSLIKSPIFSPSMIDDEGNTIPALEDYDLLGISNPAALIENMLGEAQNYRFLGSIGFQIDLIKGIKLQSLFGADFDNNSEKIFVPQNGVYPDQLPNGWAYNTSKSITDRYYSLYNDTRLNYGATFKYNHDLSAILGLRYKTNQFENDWGTGYNTPSDDIKDMGKGSSELRRNGGDIAGWKWMSYYTTISYAFRNKYFINANLSIDGSSKFGSKADGMDLHGHRFGFFPSVSAAWLISSEPFLNVNLIDILKLKASYGIAGNDDIDYYGDYKYYQSTRFIGVVGFTRGNVPNPYIQWETVKKTDIGLDLAILNERIQFTADYFIHKTEDMLTMTPVSYISGQDYIMMNDGAMENKGYETRINVRLIESQLKWDLGLGYSHYENRITALPEDEIINRVGDGYVISKVGMPTGTFWGYETNGVYATDMEAQSAGLQNKLETGLLTSFEGGDVIFVDQDQGNIIDEDDRIALGDPHPDFTGMISNQLSWKGFGLDMLITFSKGGKVYNYLKQKLQSMDSYHNQSKEILDRWQNEGDQTNIPKAQMGDPMGNARFSDRWIEDGSYIRLENITLSYDFPLKKSFLQNAMVYVSASNMLTFTEYSGFDPEFSINNSSFMQGIDFGLTPQYKSFLLGVKFGL